MLDRQFSHLFLVWNLTVTHCSHLNFQRSPSNVLWIWMRHAIHLNASLYTWMRMRTWPFLGMVEEVFIVHVRESTARGSSKNPGWAGPAHRPESWEESGGVGAREEEKKEGTEERGKKEEERSRSRAKSKTKRRTKYIAKMSEQCQEQKLERLG